MSGTARGAGTHGRIGCDVCNHPDRCDMPGIWAGPARRGGRRCTRYAWREHRTANGMGFPR
eukprot:8652231-Lingulodinium_polyedra.AAC.1